MPDLALALAACAAASGAGSGRKDPTKLAELAEPQGAFRWRFEECPLSLGFLFMDFYGFILGL